MIVVHHLNHSRSQRVLWLLEELELPYEIRAYERDKDTLRAPAQLRQTGVRSHCEGKDDLLRAAPGNCLAAGDGKRAQQRARDQ